MAATNYVTGAMGLIGFAFLIQAVSSAAPVIPAARLPSVGWLKEIRAAPVPSPMPNVVAAPVVAAPAAAPRASEHVSEPPKVPTTHEKTGHAIPARDLAGRSPQPLPPKPEKTELAKRAALAAVPADDASKAEAPKPSKPSKPAAAPSEAQSGEPEEQGIGTLAVTSNPPGAALFLDGANVGQTPIEIDVPAGIHKLRTISPIDGTDRRQTATVKANGATKVEVAF